MALLPSTAFDPRPLPRPTDAAAVPLQTPGHRTSPLPAPARRAFGSAALALAAGAALPPAVRAQLRIEITGVGSNQFPVAIAAFAADGQVPEQVDAIIRANLARSGLFRLVDPGSAPLALNAAVNHGEWKNRGADALVVGSVARLADGRFDVRFRLWDTVKQAQLDALSYVSTAADLRVNAHQISDRIYEKLTGERGVFATRIAYVAQYGKASFELQIADADGGNPKTALPSREPIMSPAWSPDGSKLAYVSFETGKPVIYTHVITSGQRRAVANFRGSNSAPAWSPDGKLLAIALTTSGLTQIYVIGADGGTTPRRLTNSGAIDTEPHWSADARYIYFTSDRGGGPQIYRMAPDGSGVQRVTFNGDYSVSPRLSPDGRTLAYVSRRSGRFQVHTLDLGTGSETLVTDTSLDESPSFAPNGRMLLYATEVNGRGVLVSAATESRVRTTLSGPKGDIREPTWGPFIK